MDVICLPYRQAKCVEGAVIIMNMATSNQNFVVDNWEDIEECGGFDTKLCETPSPEDYDNMSKETFNGPFILQDETRPHYVPPEPAVKILKRPKTKMDGSMEGHLVNGDTRPRQPIKTLQQREQEYAEARLRILGEARSPEEQQRISSVENRISKIQTKLELLRASDTSNIVRLPKGPDGSKGFNIRR